MQRQWSPRRASTTSSKYSITPNTQQGHTLQKSFSMSVAELEKKLQQRLRERGELERLARTADQQQNVAPVSSQLAKSNAAEHDDHSGERQEKQHDRLQTILAALPQTVMQELLTVTTGRPPTKASCAWHSQKQRQRFQHLIDQPICTCGAGRDISFLHDSRRHMRPYAAQGQPNNTILAEERQAAVAADNADIEKHAAVVAREARVDGIRQHLEATFVPDEYHLVRSHGVEALDVVESRYCTTLTEHKKHATAFPALIPTGRQQVKHLRQVMQNMLERLDFGGKLKNLKGPSVVHKLVELVKQEQSIYNLVFHELIRQCTVECVERGQLLADVRQQYADLLARVPEMLLGWHNEWLAQRALDRRLQEEVIHFKTELERLETILSRVEISDEHLSQEAFQLRRELRFDVQVSRDNAVQLSDYHSLYELQRKRLEKQISDLVKERAAWIRAAYQLAVKYVDDRHLEPIHTLHLSHRSWFHLAKQVTKVYEVSERRDLADLARLVDDWQRHMRRIEERLLANEVEIMKNLRILQSDMLRLLQRVRNEDESAAAAAAAENGITSQASRAAGLLPTKTSRVELEINLPKDLKLCMASWSQTLFALKLLISGEELVRTARYIKDIELTTETWISLTINLFRRHYRRLAGGQSVDIYYDWKPYDKQKRQHFDSSSDEESSEEEEKEAKGEKLLQTGDDPASADVATQPQTSDNKSRPANNGKTKTPRYSQIERKHQKKRHRRHKRTLNRDQRQPHNDSDDDFSALTREECGDMAMHFRQFVPGNMREQAGAYFEPFQFKPEFGELYRIDLGLRDVLDEQRKRMGGDNGVGTSLQKIDDDIHYVNLMRGNNDMVSDGQLSVLRDMLPNWFTLCESCLKVLEKHIPLLKKPDKSDNEEDQKSAGIKNNELNADKTRSEVHEFGFSMTKSARLIERTKRWHHLVQLQLKARDASLSERLGEINQNMLRLLIDSIVLASMTGQASEAALPNAQPEPDVLTAATGMSANQSESDLAKEYANSVGQAEPKRDGRLEMVSSYYGRAVSAYDEVIDCSRALLHATDELEPNLLMGAKSPDFFSIPIDNGRTTAAAAAVNSPGGVRIDFDWAERDQIIKEADEWCRAVAIVTNVLSRTHKMPQFRMTVRTAKANDVMVLTDSAGEVIRSAGDENKGFDDLTFEEFAQRRTGEYEEDFRVGVLQVRCLGDDDTIHVRKIDLEGEVPAILATESALGALKHAEKLTLDAETRAKDAENRVIILEGELHAAQDTVADLRADLEKKSTELERCLVETQSSPFGVGKKSNSKHRHKSKSASVTPKLHPTPESSPASMVSNSPEIIVRDSLLSPDNLARTAGGVLEQLNGIGENRVASPAKK